MSLISLLVFFIVVGVVCWAIRELSGAFGIPAPVPTVAVVLVVVFAVLYLLQNLGGHSGGPVLRF